jgi:hypothetical protein
MAPRTIDSVANAWFMSSKDSRPNLVSYTGGCAREGSDWVKGRWTLSGKVADISNFPTTTAGRTKRQTITFG